MKQLKSVIPFRIEREELYEGGGTAYVVKDMNDQEVMSNQTYYNTAPSEEDIEYVVQACNEFPTAIHLLGSVIKDYQLENGLANEIENFLKSINETK